MSATDWQNTGEYFTQTAALGLLAKARMGGYRFIEFQRIAPRVKARLAGVEPMEDGWIWDVETGRVHYTGWGDGRSVSKRRHAISDFFPFFSHLALVSRFGHAIGDFRQGSASYRFSP